MKNDSTQIQKTPAFSIEPFVSLAGPCGVRLIDLVLRMGGDPPHDLGPGHAGKADSGGGSGRICGQKKGMGSPEKCLLVRIPGEREGPGPGNGDVKSYMQAIVPPGAFAPSCLVSHK